jgi:phosphate transport system permease protein
MEEGKRRGAPLRRTSGHILGERIIAVLLASCAGISVLMMVAILAVLLGETVGFLMEVSPWEFLTETRWTPLFREKHFGILPLLSGSLLVVGGAAVISLPLGLLAAVHMREYSAPRTRALLRPLLETLVGIPTVVYGYFALTLVAPALRSIIPGMGTFSALAASVALGVMILPTVALLSEEALRGVPMALREAAYGLGATRAETIKRVVIPAALPGIVASFVLALSRAVGETMVVAIAAGGSPNLTANPLEPVQALTAYILQAGLGNVVVGTLDYRTFFVVGMVLFVITAAMNSASQWMFSRMSRRRT